MGCKEDWGVRRVGTDEGSNVVCWVGLGSSETGRIIVTGREYNEGDKKKRKKDVSIGVRLARLREWGE